MSLIRRVAFLSLHTSPMEQPGSGDAGGMNVYVRVLAAAVPSRASCMHGVNPLQSPKASAADAS